MLNRDEELERAIFFNLKHGVPLTSTQREYYLLCMASKSEAWNFIKKEKEVVKNEYRI